MSSSSHSQSGPRKASGTLGNMLSSLTSRAQTQLQNLSVSEIPHTIRQATATYDPRQSSYTLRLQLMNKALKGVIVDAEALGRERHALSKQIYLWSQDQQTAPPTTTTSAVAVAVGGQDIATISDCLAFLTYKSGDVELEYAKALESARNDLKDIRNFENDLSKDRDRRKVLETSLAKLQQQQQQQGEDKSKFHHHHQSGNQHQLEQVTTLQNELAQLDKECQVFEASLDVLKRKKIRSSFETQFAAMRELGEKLSILAGYGDLLLEGLSKDGTPPPEEYVDDKAKARTAWIRAETANALSSYRGPMIALPNHRQSGGHFDSEKHDLRSFGESHQTELANVPSPLYYDATSHTPTTSMSTSTNAVATNPLLPNPSLNHSPADPTGFSPSPSHSLGRAASLSRQNDSDQITTTPSTSTTSSATRVTIDIPPPPAGAEPTVAEIGGSIPIGTGGPSTGYFPIRRQPISKSEEVTLESHHHQQQQQQQQQGKSSSIVTQQQQGGDGNEETLPAYSIQ